MVTTSTPSLVSVITIVYNGIGDIEKTILSVIGQSLQNVEYIIIDGGSKDGTLDIITKYEDEIDFWVSEPDKGIYDAMNKGIQHATGQWINFMNCGDRFVSADVLDKFSLLNLEDVDLAYGDAIIEYPTFQKMYPRYPVAMIWREMPFCHQALFTRTVMLKSSLFNSDYKLSADYEFIYRAIVDKRRLFYFNMVVCYFSFKDGVSKKNPIRSIYERKIIALQKEYKLYRNLYYLWLLAYLNVTVVIKKILGDKITAWLTRILRT